MLVRSSQRLDSPLGTLTSTHRARFALSAPLRARSYMGRDVSASHWGSHNSQMQRSALSDRLVLDRRLLYISPPSIPLIGRATNAAAYVETELGVGTSSAASHAVSLASIGMLLQASSPAAGRGHLGFTSASNDAMSGSPHSSGEDVSGTCRGLVRSKAAEYEHRKTNKTLSILGSTPFQSYK
jgi:hypothetical protein